ncbi:MAG TPA: AI-2E family transporter, partial [Gemmatimonadales bacterium]|nr:AI-2E family transporter [Gemmatimonadales bacterium]
MAFLDSSHQRAAILILLLGAGLLFALAPYASGLIGGLVLYVIFAPVHGWLRRWLSPRIGAGLVASMALLVILVPSLGFAGLVANQAQAIASGVLRGPLLDRLAQLQVAGYPLGPRLAGLGEQIVGWMGSGAFGLLGTATRIGLNLTIALFIVYYLLLRPRETWEAVKPYIPFSPATADRLRDRFRDVTISTVIGTGLIAVIQGALVAGGFWLTGLSNPVFWGVVTVVLAILPVVGSGLVWGPGALTLLLDHRYGAGIVLLILGVLVVGNVDVVIRPAVYRRYAQIHPLVTLVGAIGGVGYFGLLGILIGPLAVSYFFE